jgi:hypothetical protein
LDSEVNQKERMQGQEEAVLVIQRERTDYKA